jgi:hypothetical protein
MEKMKNPCRLISPMLLVSLMILSLLFSLADRPQAETIVVADGADLIEQGKSLDGQEVVFEGEVIGDIMRRGDHAWINVLNHGTAIGVWVTEEQCHVIGLTGRYGTTGDQVRITGLFRRSCAEHGGDLDIHAASLEVLQTGTRISMPLDKRRLAAAIVLLIMAVLSLIWLFLPRVRRGWRYRN